MQDELQIDGDVRVGGRRRHINDQSLQLLSCLSDLGNKWEDAEA